ncbi:MAG: sigma-54 dependent transcriptional regulator [Phycisphaerae bacterium]|nr:sigma-54 dependent transcriptional regulator [Phycisphaerae bacterium]
MTTTDKVTLKKILIIGKNTELQDSAARASIPAEIFAADDLAEAQNLIESIDVDIALIENSLPPANIQKFFSLTALNKKTVIVATDDRNKYSKTDYLNSGVFAYIENISGPNGLADIIKAVTEDEKPAEVGFFLNSFASSVPIAGKSPAIAHTLKMIELVGSSSCNPVLVIGQTGTGKESAAKAVHRIRHPDKPFVAVNCAALTANLLESELFGHAKGAFTGADKEKTGLLELAGAGTLFLDEISEIPLELQAKLLRVLQEKTFRKVGGLGDVECQATIIASSNRNLKDEVREKRFRGDLYYRLNICPVVLAPLSSEKRKQDIPILAEYFLSTTDIYPEKSKKIKGFTPPAIEALMQYDWPGNIRELKNVVERAVLLETTDKIGIDSIIIDPAEHIDSVEYAKDSPSEKLKDFSLIKAEKELIKRALVETDGQKTRAAGLLGITRATLYAKLKQYDFEQNDNLPFAQNESSEIEAEENSACAAVA